MNDNENKITPGPWEVEPTVTRALHVTSPTGIVGCGFGEANARAIAALPDCLAALAALAEWAAAVCPQLGATSRLEMEARVATARFVLAEATGGDR